MLHTRARRINDWLLLLLLLRRLGCLLLLMVSSELIKTWVARRVQSQLPLQFAMHIRRFWFGIAHSRRGPAHCGGVSYNSEVNNTNFFDD